MRRIRGMVLAAVLMLGAKDAAHGQAKSDGSVYLRCDGMPAHISVGDAVGRALLLGFTLGIAGNPEIQDASKRLYGNDGVEACDLAIQDESDAMRKVQLMLARSIHQIEKGDYAAALEDARRAPALAGAQAEEIGFRHTLLVSALDIQAAILVRAGRMGEAEATAAQMADAAPYEVLAQVRAANYMQLTPELTPAKQAFLDRLVKIYPDLLPLRASAHEWAGKYLEAADDYGDIVETRAGFSPGSDAPPMPAALALRSVMLALAGQREASATLAANTAAMIRVLTATGKAGLMQSSIDAAEQALDFRAIVQDLADGHAGAARIKFAARSHWSVPSAPVVAELAARLREGASVAELTGGLATDPAKLREAALVANAGALTLAQNGVALLYGLVRKPVPASSYRDWGGDAWNVKDAVFLHKRAAGENYAGELLAPPRPGIAGAFFAPPHFITVATGEAFLLHAALLAQARGVKGFVLWPARKQIDVVLLRFGNPGEPGFPTSVTFDAGRVIADLSSVFPDPNANIPAKK